MQGYYDIEKHKAEFIDGEWVPVELIETRTEKNFITHGIRGQANGGRTNVSISSVFEGDRTFGNTQRLAIFSAKIYSKSFKQTDYPITDSSSESVISGIRGDQSVGRETPAFVAGTPNTITTEARWNPPTNNPRVIYSIACYYQTNSSSPLSIVSLNTPCIQATNELLIVRYRYNWYDEGVDRFSNYSSPEVQFYVSASAACGHNASNPHNNMTAIKYSTFAIEQGNKNVDFAVATDMASTYISTNFAEGYQRRYHGAGNNDAIGRLFCTAHNYKPIEYNNLHTSVIPAPPVYFRTELTNVNLSKIRRPQDTVIQSTFHKAMALDPISRIPKPFLDTDTIGNGLGKAVLSDSIINGDTSYDTVNGFAELFRTHITTGGAIGTSEYKISKRNFLGVLSQNDWSNRVTSKLNIGSFSDANRDSRQRNYNSLSPAKDTGLYSDSTVTGATSSSNVGYYIQTYAYPEFISVNTKPNGRNAIFIRSIHFIDEDDHIEFSAGTTPSLPVTDIKQVEGFEDGTVMVACGDTGLWKIERNVGDVAALATITRMTPAGLVDNTKCQVFSSNAPRHTGKLGTKWYAMFSTDLAYTQDQGSTWTILNSTTSPQFVLTRSWDAVEYSKVRALHIDSSHPDERMMFLMTNTINSGDDGSLESVQGITQIAVGYWWSFANSVSTSDEVAFSLGTSYQNWLYPIAAEKMVHAILGSDKWVIHDDIGSWQQTTTFTNRGAVSGSANPTSMMYDEDIDQYIFLCGIGSTNSSGAMGGYNGRGFTSLDAYDTGSPYTPNRVLTAPLNSNNSAFTNTIAGFYIGKNIMIIRASESLDTATAPYWYGEFTSTTVGMVLHDTSHDHREKGNDRYIDGKNNAWEYYGWNGSEWVLGYVGSKPTHLAVEPVINGLDISFTELVGSEGSSDTFVFDDVYDTYVYDGIVKDDTTEFEIDYLMLSGPGNVNTGTTPSVIPNPAGVTTIPYCIDYTVNETDKFEQVVVYERNYMGCFSSNVNSTNNGNDAGVIGPDLDGDYNIEFGMSTNYSNYQYPNSISPSYICRFGFASKSSIITGSPTTVDYGVYLWLDVTDPDVARIYFTTLGTTTYITVNDYDPINDVYNFQRIGSTLSLSRNGTIIHTFGTNITGVLKGIYNAQSDVHSTNIWNATITFDDLRHVVHIGNGVDNGASDPNFGRMSENYYQTDGTIEIDGVPAVILTTDGITLPAQGEVYIHRGSGELSFNVADVGKAITCSWMVIPASNDSVS